MDFRTWDDASAAAGQGRKSNSLRGGRRRGAGLTAAAAARQRCVAEPLEERRLFATFVVNGFNDTGPGSLREAINQSNALLGVDTITFAIAPGGVQTIEPQSELPTIIDPVIIDGFSQPPVGGGEPGDTPMIAIDGSQAGGDGLTITGGNSIIRGLIIKDWDNGIVVNNVGGNTIVGCWIGVDVDGVTPDGNNGDGIILNAGDNIIGSATDLGGGTATDPAVRNRNVISANGGDGIDVNSAGNIIQNNFIGVDITGQVDLGNSSDGIEISNVNPAGNLVGGTAADESNVIAFNGGNGITVLSGSGNSFVRNSISENTGLGIDLGDDGIDGIDALDADSGPNDRLNRPVLAAAPTVGGVTVLRGLVNSLPNQLFRVEFFTDFDPGEDAGEGQIFLDSIDVTTGPDGTFEFSHTLPVFVPVGRAISATSTILGPGGFELSTSEFALNIEAGTTPGIDVEGGGQDIPSDPGLVNPPVFENETNFGTVDLDAGPREGFFVITNTGTSILNLTGTPRVQISGPDAAEFQVTQQPAGSLDPDEDSGFTIVFDPSTPGPKTAIVTIPNTDEDENPYTFLIAGTGAQKSVVISDAQVVEGNGGLTDMVFTVTLSSPSTQDVQVLVGTTDLVLDATDATPGEDYQPISTVVTIPAGSTSATVTVPIIGDTDFEFDETVTVVIASVSGDLVVADATGVGTILNDEGPPQVGIGDANVLEGQDGTRPMVFTINLPGPAQVPVTINYSTSNGTATAGVDYLPTSGTVTVPVGSQSATVEVTVIGDRVAESDETFFVNISGPSGAVLGDAQAVGTIVNDDRTFQFGNIGDPNGGTGTVVETPGGSFANFVIRLDAPSTEEIRVNYATRNGTATAPADYTPMGGTLIFAPGETSKTISVPVAPDTLVEGDENFFIALSNPVNAGLTLEAGEFIIKDSSLPVLSVDSRSPATFTDATGDTVTVAIKGPGQAFVQFASNTGNSDPVGLIVDGTTNRSTITITATGAGTSLGGVNINRTVRAIVAPNTDLTGGLTARGGIRGIQFRDVNANDQTLSIPARGTVQSITFNRVADLNIISSARIANLTVAEWLDTKPGVDTIRTPSLTTLNSAGDFSADIRTGTLHTARISGTLLASDIRNTVGIKQLNAGAIRDSIIFVGVSENFVGLPRRDEEFFNDAGFIRILQTNAFSNSRIAAPVQGDLELGAIETENADVPLGVSADRIAEITGTTSRGPLAFSRLDAPQSQQEDDFLLFIYE